MAIPSSLDKFFEDQLDRVTMRLERYQQRRDRRARRRRIANRPLMQEMDANMLIGSIASSSAMGHKRPTLDQLDLDRSSWG